MAEPTRTPDAARGYLTKAEQLAAALDRLVPIDVPEALAALARLQGDESDRRIVAETLGLLEGRIEALLDSPGIASVLREDATDV